MLASASKDEQVIVWNMEKVKSCKDQSQQQDAIVAVLREHENLVDCVLWAPLEANHVIDSSEYNKSSI
jgi:hypothetical protein